MPALIGALILSAIGFGGVAGLGVTIFGIGIGSVATVLGTAVITAALIGLQLFLAPGVPGQPDGAVPLQQATPPRRGAYGRVRLSGYYMLYEVNGGISYDIFAVVSGKIGGFVSYFLHDDAVTIDGSGVVHEGEAGRYGGYNITIKTRLGLVTETAYTELTTALPEIWTAGHRGDGTASLALICRGVKADQFQKIYPHGLPQPSAVLDGYPIWDPRDVAQDREDPNTWGVSSNPVLQMIDYITHADHGMRLEYEFYFAPRIESWKAQADLCDALVAKVVGTEKRYESHGWYAFDTKPSEVIGSILSTCDGWLHQDGEGAFVIQVGVYSAPTITLAEKHRLALNVNYGVEDEQTVNELTLSFISPAHKYKETPITSWRDEEHISYSGIVRTRALTFDWVQTHSQARRLAKRSMSRLNPGMHGTVVTTLYGLRALGHRWVRFQFSAIFSGLTDAVVEIKSSKIDLMQGRVTFEFMVVDPATMDAWDPATEEGPDPTVVTQLPTQTLPIPEDIVVEANGSPPFHIDITWNDPGRTDLDWRIRYRLFVGPSPWTEVLFTSPTDLGDRLQVIIYPTTDDIYELQIAAVGPGGTVGEWSDAVTTALVDDAILRETGALLLRENGNLFVREDA